MPFPVPKVGYKCMGCLVSHHKDAQLWVPHQKCLPWQFSLKSLFSVSMTPYCFSNQLLLNPKKVSCSAFVLYRPTDFRKSAVAALNHGLELCGWEGKAASQGGGAGQAAGQLCFGGGGQEH